MEKVTEQNGFILINKRVGVTSRSVDNVIQRLFHTRKVGHLGTLDPFASGLLVIAINKGCKSLPFLDDSFKTYQASLYLGKSTATGDLTGEVKEEKEVPDLDEKKIKKVFDSFLGVGEQIPPMTSALHHEGKRLYDLSRKGVEIVRKPRRIEIKSLKLLSFAKNKVTFEVVCSRGTYVRTLAEDIAIKLGTVGHLTGLNRTAIGNKITLEMAKDIEKVTTSDLINPASLIELPSLEIEDDNLIQDIKSGKRITLNTEHDQILLYTRTKANYDIIALAVYNRDSEDEFVIQRGLW